MKGRKTNLIIAFTNILISVMFLVYIYLYKENAITFTRHHKLIFDYIKGGMLVILITGLLSNFVYLIGNIKNGKLYIYYMLTFGSLLYLFQLEYIYSIFLIVPALLIIKYMKRNNYIEKENNNIIMYNIFLILSIVFLTFSLLTYKQIGAFLKKKENVNLIKYEADYFKYITPPEKEEIYINMQNSEGLWGYVNVKGEEKIEFKYDYATPFYTIKVFDKEFEIAGVTQKSITTLILKNKREVMSFNSEYDNENKLAKLKEFEEVLKNELKLTDIKEEAQIQYKNLKKKKIYEEKDAENKQYTYRYDYSEKYDLLVYESQIGNKTIYKFANKDNVKETIDINAENLIYDKSGLYVFENGYMPFYSPSKQEQGWFDKEGKRKKITGKIQILDVTEDKILIKNYNKDIVYFVDYNINQISNTYKEVVKHKEHYIVKNSETNKWTIIDKNFAKVINEEYDVFSDKFLTEGGYLFANISTGLDIDEFGYIKINYLLVTDDFKNIKTDFKNIYNLYYRLENKENENIYYDLVDKIKKGDVTYPGDLYYKTK